MQSLKERNQLASRLSLRTEESVQKNGEKYAMAVTVSINPIAQQTAGVPFTVTGTITYTAALQFSDDGNPFQALPSGSSVPPATANFSFLHPPIPNNGSHTVSVKDSVSSVVATSNTFAVVVAGLKLLFNPADKSSGVTLAAVGGVANRKATVSGSGSVRSSLARLKGNGLVAFQATIDTVTGTWAIGICNESYALDSGAGIGADTNAIGFYVSTAAGEQPPQAVYFDNSELTSGTTASVNGSVVSCIVDFQTLQIWFSTPEMRAAGTNWNNSSTANPATKAGGFSFAAMAGPYYHAVFNSTTTGAAATINGGHVAFDSFLTSYLTANPGVTPWAKCSINYTDAPGADDSFVKRPFQTGAQWVADTNAAITSLRQTPAGINPGSNWGQPVYVSDASGILVTIAENDSSLTIQMHVPLGAAPAKGAGGPTPDAHMNFFDTSIAPKMVSCFRASVNNADANGGVTAATTLITCDDLQIDNAYGIVAVDRITGQPGKNAGLGVIRNWHLAQASADPSFVIPNMLRWAGGLSQMYWNPSWAINDVTKINPTTGLPSIMWPKAIVDSSAPTSYTGQCPAGATIGIPASTARPTGKTRGFYLLFDTLQQFGACWEDTAGSVGIVLYADYIKPQYMTLFNDMQSNISAISPYLSILANQNGLSSLKGGLGGANAFAAPPSLDTTSFGGSPTGGWQPSGYTG
jgi:hypothetical protein